jgi:hypothetical protein
MREGAGGIFRLGRAVAAPGRRVSRVPHAGHGGEVGLNPGGSDLERLAEPLRLIEQGVVEQVGYPRDAIVRVPAAPGCH